MYQSNISRRSIFNLIIVFALLLLLFYPGGNVQAADFTAGDETELNAHITTANGTGEADTITLTADITLSAELTNITSDITIEGAGYTIDINSNPRMVATTGILIINQLTVINGTNTGANGGGGIFNFGGVLSINNSTFSNNSATNSASNGGAILSTGSLTINNSTFSSNTATDPASNGGAIHNTGTLTIDNSTFSGNTAGNRGGAVHNSAGGTMTIDNSTFSSNFAAYGGGVLNYNSPNVNTINNSTFSSNTITTATGSGGGLRNTGTLTVNNSTFYGNSAGTGGGGGIYNNSTLALNRNIVSGNTTTAAGGAEVFHGGGTTTANNYNVFSQDGITIAQAFSGIAPGANDYDASSDANNNALSTILNTSLADNDGPTWTHALVDGSPAHEFVPNTDADCTAGVSADQRGGVRAGGTATTGDTHCDSGAVEHNSDFTPTVVTVSSLNAQTAIPMVIVILVLALITAGGFITWQKFKKQNN